jgi:nucleotide-binding universal stress UspA family protein
MYERILVATDGSADAERAAAHGLDLARQYGAELHAVYVVETRTAYDNAIVEPEEVRENLRAEGGEAIAAIEAEAGDDVRVVGSVLEGIPHEQIVDYVEDGGIDLIVMGARGRSTFKTILLGSVTEGVFLSTDVPVLVVGGGLESAADDGA